MKKLISKGNQNSNQKMEAVIISYLGKKHNSASITHSNESKRSEKSIRGKRIKILREMAVHPYSPRDLTTEI